MGSVKSLISGTKEVDPNDQNILQLSDSQIEQKDGSNPDRMISLLLSGKHDSNDVSYAQVKNEAELQLMEKPISLDRLLQKKKKEQNYEMEVLYEIAPEKDSTNTFQMKDVYCNIHPFKETMVQIR